jgi:hypothetical protein
MGPTVDGCYKGLGRFTRFYRVAYLPSVWSSPYDLYV